ncbi:signal peptidase I [Lacticaseibacillus porcinae]|uniref:signal peptidase I n=1 Tax=Lacticaseibacillus porcinae TaxID=1123687 RepID=UPI000F779EB1|nr:signal peptidase I [Lacticaseibacillus porcinae]
MASQHQPTWRWLLLLVVVFIAVFSGTRYFIANDIVDGTSMQPTLQSGERLVSIKHQTPKRFDIVVLTEPVAPHALFIKRVIGLPGDTIKVVDDQLWINGQRVNEPYLKTAFAKQELKQFQRAHAAATFTANFSLSQLKATRAKKVPAGHYFVMGDNRLVSYDSRGFGFVSKAELESVVIWRYWPLTQMRGF